MLAYLDANSGSMLVGAIAAAGAGVAVAAKVGWGKVTGAFKPKKRVEDDGTPAVENTEDEPAASTADEQ